MGTVERRDPEPIDPGAAVRVLGRLRDLAADLDDLERCVLAALVAPGLQAALSDDTDDADGLVQWTPERIPEALARVGQREPRRLVVD